MNFPIKGKCNFPLKKILLVHFLFLMERLRNNKSILLEDMWTIYGKIYFTFVSFFVPSNINFERDWKYSDSIWTQENRYEVFKLNFLLLTTWIKLEKWSPHFTVFQFHSLLHSNVLLLIINIYQVFLRHWYERK